MWKRKSGKKGSLERVGGKERREKVGRKGKTEMGRGERVGRKEYRQDK
jgi:hypothetical protein